MRLSSHQIEDLLHLVRRRYPDWDGFEHTGFEHDEVESRQATVEKAAERLNRYLLRQLRDEGRTEDLIRHLLAVGRAGNLLYLSVPRAGDLNLLYDPNLDPTAFAEHIVDLLYGPGSSPERLARYLAYIEAQGLPNKWTFPTYFLFVCHPETDLFVKPRTLRRFLRRLGAPFTLGPPSAEGYAQVLDLARALSVGLARYGPRDMVDLQALIRVCAREVRAEEGPTLLVPSKRRTFLAWFEHFVQIYAAPSAGQAHLADYATSSEAGRRNFEAVVAAFEQGEDVTDQVLRTLLPHTDTLAHRQSDVWISVASVISGDVKHFFERAGWTESSDWPRIAQAILHFYRTCEEDPVRLKQACTTFAGLPYTKGFQAGMLTPMLHALRPETFVPFNHRVQRVLNHFTGARHGTRLLDYPDANATALQFVKAVAEEFRQPGVPEAPPLRLLALFSHWLMTESGLPLTEPNHWKIAPGDQGWQWDECRTGGFIALGWSELGDLTDVSRRAFEVRRDEALERFGDWTKTGANQAWTFARQIAEGDHIVANRGTKEVLGIGVVTGPYFYKPGERHAHRVPVDWKDVTPRQVNERGWRRTVVKLPSKTFERIVAAPRVQRTEEPSVSYTATPDPNRYTLAQCAADTGFAEDELGRWVRIIERKRQAIFYGPPGTGKTYLAQHLARHLAQERDGFVELVQFHPAYTYEDFIQGIRPRPGADGRLDYPLVPGLFLRFCERAREVDGRCVLIIDEINRADLARVFGELMVLLEYRDQDVVLAGGEAFRIPDNVRLLGTMNTADRSIALVDHALRRRFAFIALHPRYELLRRYHAETGFRVEGLIEVLRHLNAEIGDARYAVGVSFFLVPDLEAHLGDIWQMEIEPYLEEYFFDQPARVESFRWATIKGRVRRGG